MRRWLANPCNLLALNGRESNVLWINVARLCFVSILNARQGGVPQSVCFGGFARFQESLPRYDLREKTCEVQSSFCLTALAQFIAPSLEQRLSPLAVAACEMMKCRSNLNDTLKKDFFLALCF